MNSDCVNTKKILIVGPSWVGDMVMAQTLFKVIKRRLPGSSIDVIAPDWSKPILERMPEVSGAISMPLGHGELGVKKRRHLGKALRDVQYDWSIVLPNSFKSAIVPFSAKVPKRTGWRGELRFGLINDMRQLDKASLPFMIQRFAALGFEAPVDLKQLDFSQLPWPELSVDKAQAAIALKRFGLSLQRPIMVMCPGAEFGESKCWPAEYYAKVAQRYAQEGWQVWLMGSKNDGLIAEQIQQAVSQDVEGFVVNLTGKTALSEAIDLMRYSNCVLTNDSGLMHVAAALDRPVVAIYGSTSPDFTPPLSSQAKQVYLDLACRPCFERACPLVHLNCLKQLSPGQVIREIDALLSSSAVTA